jgi:formylglycine-generating enzyme required for sulfatase activity
MVNNDPLNLVGSTLAHKYALESVVRVEAGAVVYRATNLATNRSIAVRVLGALGQLPAGKRKALYERLSRDHEKLGELAAILPAAYPTRDVGTVGTSPRGKIPWVALDWPQGVTLAQMMQPGHEASLPDSVDEVLGLLEPIAVALAIAHEHGVVHGGITLDRVLFREDGVDGRRRGTLLDFGSARALFSLDAKRDATPEDDVRALAVLAAHVLARSCGADASDSGQKTPRARGVVVSDEIEAVFARAASRTSYESVGEMWGALRHALGMGTLRSLEQTVPPEPSLFGSASRSLRPIARSTPPPASQGATPPRLRPMIYAAVGVAVLALGAVTYARASRSAAAATAITCPAGMIAAGGASVRLGEAGDADNPPHNVTLHPFCIDRDAVTTGSYEVCASRGACANASRTNEWDGITADDRTALDPFCTARDPDGRATHPINCVSWEMATAYCADRDARLPTEAELEGASHVTTAGIAEWAADWRAPLGLQPSEDPRGPAAGEERVVRGAHSAGTTPSRFGASPATRSHAIGFRCAKSP